MADNIVPGKENLPDKYKSKNLEKISNDDFLRATGERLIPYVQSGWKEKIDYNNLFYDSKVLLMGDTDHRMHGALGGLEKEMANLKAAGVNDFAFEIPCDEKNLNSLENFYQTGEVSHIRTIAEGTRTPIRIIRLLKSAYDAGIKIHFVDMPQEAMQSSWDEAEMSRQRGVYMGKKVAEIASQVEKLPVFVGYGHFDEKEIPSQLRAANINYKKIALVNAGQPDPTIPLDGHFITMGAAVAVGRLGLNDKIGLVDLMGNYGLDGYIHFPRVQLVENVKQLNLPETLLLGENGKNNESSESLSLIKPDTSLPSLSFSFKEMVDPVSYTWEETNAPKIFHFINNLNGLKPGQKLYLSIMLENYVRTTMRHSGGSILNIEYDSEAQAFGIDTIDTAMYKYNPKMDYGTRQRHREVTLDTILKHFGFEELIVKNINDLPQTDIKPNPKNPSSAYKFLFLLSAKATDPKAISSSINYISIRNKRNNIGITHLTLDDFLLSEMESKIKKIADKGEEICKIYNDIYTEISKAAEKSKGQKEEELSSAGRSLLNSTLRSAIGFGEECSAIVLGARSRLQYTDDNAAHSFATLAEAYFKNASQTLEKVKEVTEKHQELYEGIFKPWRSGEEYIFKDHLKFLQDSFQNSLEELKEIKESLSPTEKQDIEQIKPISYHLNDFLEKRAQGKGIWDKIPKTKRRPLIKRWASKISDFLGF